MQKEHALAIATRFYEERFADAAVGLLAGSIVRGTGQPHSDIDLVVLYPEGATQARRESHLVAGLPIECFIHTTDAQDWFFDKDRLRGIPVMMTMVAEGLVTGSTPALAARQKEKARAIIEAGPPVLDEAALKARRYALTDGVDDLRDPRDEAAILGCLAQLFPDLGDFHLRANRLWSAQPKALIARIAEVDALLATRYLDAFQRAHRGEKQPLIALAEEILAPHGGRYWEGDRRLAPDDWRKVPSGTTDGVSRKT